jgi:hypothetical protein
VARRAAVARLVEGLSEKVLTPVTEWHTVCNVAWVRTEARGPGVATTRPAPGTFWVQAWQAHIMGFKIHSASGEAQFGQDAIYSFNQAGLLVINLGRRGGRLTYSPHAWTLVEEPDDDGRYLEGPDEDQRFEQRDPLLR